MRLSRLVEKSEDLATGLASTSLLVVHDAEGGGQDNMTETTSREDVLHPLLDILDLHIEARRDDTALVDAANQLNDDLARSVVINNLELSNVA